MESGDFGYHRLPHLTPLHLTRIPVPILIDTATRKCVPKIKEKRVRMKRSDERHSRGLCFFSPYIMCTLASEGPSQHAHRSVVGLKNF